MESTISPLLQLFYREQAAGNAVALGVLLATQGSTYRKPGALMLIAAPVGLPLGGRSPESVALSIVAEIHAFVFESQSGAPEPPGYPQRFTGLQALTEAG